MPKPNRQKCKLPPGFIHGLDPQGFPLTGKPKEQFDRMQKDRASAELARVLTFGDRSPRGRRMLENLRRLTATRKESQTFSYREIAKECGVSHELIRLIARSGLRKLRNRLPKEAREAFDTLMARGRTLALPKSPQHENSHLANEFQAAN